MKHLRTLQFLATVDTIYSELFVLSLQHKIPMLDPTMYMRSVVGTIQSTLSTELSTEGSGAKHSMHNPLLEYLQLRKLESANLGIGTFCICILYTCMQLYSCSVQFTLSCSLYRTCTVC